MNEKKRRESTMPASLKKWEELDICDDFMFGKIMQDPELCRETLETILNIKIDHIEYPELQKTINIRADAKSVRLDVYVKDGKGTIYNIEMQAVNSDHLPKRSRYYSGMIDLNLIEKGVYYASLNRSIVIFICNFDLFGCGRHVYTFENLCREDPSICLDDDSVRIFLNAKGTMDDVSDSLKAFLKYVADGTVIENSFVNKVDNAVKKARENEEWRREYMTLLMRDQEHIEQGRQEGREEGRKEGRIEGRKEGRIEGRKEGRIEALISLVRMKSAKGLSVDAIADFLEESPEYIQTIVDCINEHTDADDSQILSKLYEILPDTY